MNDTADGKRKPRSIMATESEWIRIMERAKRDRISTSRHVVQQSLATIERPAQEGRLPLSVQCRAGASPGLDRGRAANAP